MTEEEMIDLPIGKAIIAKASDDKCSDCIGDILFNCLHIACASDERADGNNIIYRVIDLPQPVDVTPLLDALRNCKRMLDDKTVIYGMWVRDYYADKAQEISAVLEKWEADHAGD
jgi:hypothetical protein